MMTDPTKIFSKEDSCLSLNEMMDYIHDRLSNKERNHVERHTLQCEFCSEAMDGLALVNEEKGKDIIESIDETNQMEPQILFAANEINELSESVADYEKALKPMAAAAAPSMKRKKEAEETPVVSIQEINNKKSFDWRRLAAMLAGALFIGGGLIYFIRNDFRTDTNRVAIESKPSVFVPSEPKINKRDSVIAIAPVPVPPSKEFINRSTKSNSDGIIYSDDELSGEDRRNEVVLEKDVKNESSRALPGQSVEPAVMAAPMKEEVLQEEENADKLLKEKKEEAKVEYYSRKNISEKKTEEKGKTRAAAIAATKTDMASDSIGVSDGSINNDFEEGVTLYKKAEYQKAISYFEKLDKKDRNYEEARWYLANSYLRIGEKEKAKEVLKEIVELNGVYKKRAEEELSMLE